MVVVIDSSVWVSAMHFTRRESSPVLALQYARNRDTIATCDQIVDEVRGILVDKFCWEPSAVDYRLGVLLAKSIRVPVPGNLHACRDPNDDMVLECAVAAGAQIILTGDKDLLALNPFRGNRIVTPADFLTIGA